MAPSSSFPIRKIPIPVEGIETLFGSFDENLKNFQLLFNVEIRTHGSELLVEGRATDIDKLAGLVEQLGVLLRNGYDFAKGDVKRAARLVAQDPAIDLADYFLRGTMVPLGKRRVMPKSINQRKYLDAIDFLEKRLIEVNHNKSNELIWILEHPSTFTTGMSYDKNEILDKRINLIKTNRGGKITWHGPGQLICYFVIDLNKRKKNIRNSKPAPSNCYG